MSRKIIGITVGTQLPKPNFEQSDPTKGDYIKNKPDFKGLKTQVTELSEYAELYLLNINYEDILAFDTSEIIFGTSTLSVLGQAILGQMVLA